jgi:hypothetical protein
LKGGNAGGSVKMSAASTQKLPTTEPPMSEWCSTLATQQNSCPPAKTGAATMVSGWCGVPTYGSLDRNMSPGPIPGSALRCSKIHWTVSDWALEKYCRYGPRNTSSPRWVRIDGWKSRVSMVIGETHSRCSVWPCSTLAFSRA